MTTIAPDRTVNVTCKTCPPDATPIAEIAWHSSDPSHTVELKAISGLAATLSGTQTNYTLGCDGHDTAQAVNLSKAELIKQAEAAWTQRQPISV